jgi:SAM-dependent methyltransferase
LVGTDASEGSGEMTKSNEMDNWAAGPSYEYFMGRWSRLIARGFLEWIAPRPGLNWLEIGCGTGALSEMILTHAAPASLIAIDPSMEFIGFARNTLPDTRVIFQVGNALDLPAFPHPIDVIVSGLAMNFIGNPILALRALRDALQPDGILAFYVWDYAGKMEMLRYFWDSVVALDPGARSLDEGVRFPLCQPDALRHLSEEAGLNHIAVTAIETSMVFFDFKDYWAPFLGGAGPAAGYVARLDAPSRSALEEHLRQRLPIQEDGSLTLAARAWAVLATP